MGLLEKASLVITTNGYKEGKLYSVVPNTALGDMDVVRATTATRVNSAGLIETVGLNVPRIDYSNGSCPSILVEPQRTNLLLSSEQLDSVNWQKANSTILQNVTTSPDGAMTADSIISNTITESEHRVRASNAMAINTAYVASVFIKKINIRYFYIRDLSGSRYCVYDIDLINVSFQSPEIVGKIEPYSNGFFRITATFTTPSTIVNNLVDFGITSSNNLFSSVVPIGNSGVIFGAQLETGSYPTSYIPTVASAVTRNADVISKTGISSLIGQTEGTLFCEIKVNKLIGTASRYIFHISDGTANNRIYMAFSGSSSNVLRARIFNGGTLQCSIDSSTITNTGTYKLALAYNNNDIVFYINGVQIGVDTSATIPTCSRVDIGHNYAGASQLGDEISNSIIFKTRLSNTELETLTTI